MKLFSVNEFWIKVGIYGFLGDIFYSFVTNEIEYKVHRMIKTLQLIFQIYIQRKFEQMLSFIENGCELSPVGNPQFSHEA